MAIDISEESIAASADDCTQNFNFPAAPFSTTQTTVSSGEAGGVTFRSGLRFTTIPIPKGATIISASISLYASAAAGIVPLTIRGEIADDAAAWSTELDFNIRRISTYGPVNWASGLGEWNIDTWEVSPDISSIIQLIIDRPGWAINNDLALFWDSTVSGGDNYRQAHSFDHSSGNAPKFNASYILAGQFISIQN
jgi:hypothetical protein